MHSIVRQSVSWDAVGTATTGWLLQTLVPVYRELWHTTESLITIIKSRAVCSFISKFSPTMSRSIKDQIKELSHHCSYRLLSLHGMPTSFRQSSVQSQASGRLYLNNKTGHTRGRLEADNLMIGLVVLLRLCKAPLAAKVGWDLIIDPTTTTNTLESTRTQCSMSGNVTNLLKLVLETCIVVVYVPASQGGEVVSRGDGSGGIDGGGRSGRSETGW